MSGDSETESKRAGEATLDEISEIAERELNEQYPVDGELYGRGIQLSFVDDSGEEWTWTVTVEDIENVE
jgi:hypothetical protein